MAPPCAVAIESAVFAMGVKRDGATGPPVREQIDFSTGAVVIDIRFDQTAAQRLATGSHAEFAHRPETTLVMTYLDPTDGRVKERNACADRYASRRKRLRLP